MSVCVLWVIFHHQMVWGHLSPRWIYFLMLHPRKHKHERCSDAAMWRVIYAFSSSKEFKKKKQQQNIWKVQTLRQHVIFGSVISKCAEWLVIRVGIQAHCSWNICVGWITRTQERFAPYQRCVLERYTPTPWTIAVLIWNSGNRAELKKNHDIV